MLNFDKYREEIDRIIENSGAPRHMISRLCLQKTNLESVNADGVLGWLFSEYKPPLLENGDDLNPGDWIMVREPDDEAWVKKIFAYYYDGRFYCANDIAFFKNGLLVNRTKARLPEDGE